MLKRSLQNLNVSRQLILEIPINKYKEPCPGLSGSSIGEHTRHWIEFYLCLLSSLENGIVNYDKRERDLKIEISPSFAAQKIDFIIDKLSENLIDKDLILKDNITTGLSLKTTLFRELYYCLEHSVHHQAFVKIGLRELGLLHLSSPNYGVADSTLAAHKIKMS